MVDSMQQQTTDNVDLQPHSSTAKTLCDSNDQWQEFDIDFKRTSRKPFGFSITGGNEYSSDISIAYIKKDGAADCDGRLKLGDIILHVNNISFKEISHHQAVHELQSAGKQIRIRVRRLVPRITEEIPPSTQNNSPRISCVGSMFDRITFTRKIASSNVDDQSQQLPHATPCMNKNLMSQLRNSENQSNITNKPVREYEVGTYENLKRRLLRRNDLEVHHLIQSDIASALIPAYKESEAICIALDSSKYHPVVVMSQNQINLLFSDSNPKKILAYGIGHNIKPRTVPSPVLLEAIQLHCQQFPHIFKKATLNTSRQDNTTIKCDGNELASRIPLMDPSFVGKAQDIMKYGNCVKDLLVKVRRFLEETGTSEVCSWENPDLSGKYVVHQDTNPVTGQQRFLTIHIKLADSETRKEESDDCVTTITTYHNKIIIRYE